MFSFENEAFLVITVIETVEPKIIAATALPIVKFVAHFQLVLFVKGIKDFLSVNFGILGRFEKGHVLSVLTVD